MPQEHEFQVGQILTFVQHDCDSCCQGWVVGDLAEALTKTYMLGEYRVHVKRLRDGYAHSYNASCFVSVEPLSVLPEPKKTSYDADF